MLLQVVVLPVQGHCATILHEQHLPLVGHPWRPPQLGDGDGLHVAIGEEGGAGVGGGDGGALGQHGCVEVCGLVHQVRLAALELGVQDGCCCGYARANQWHGLHGAKGGCDCQHAALLLPRRAAWMYRRCCPRVWWASQQSSRTRAPHQHNRYRIQQDAAHSLANAYTLLQMQGPARSLNWPLFYPVMRAASVPEHGQVALRDTEEGLPRQRGLVTGLTRLVQHGIAAAARTQMQLDLAYGGCHVEWQCCTAMQRTCPAD